MTSVIMNSSSELSVDEPTRSSVKGALVRIFRTEERIELTEANDTGRFRYEYKSGTRTISDGYIELSDNDLPNDHLKAVFDPFKHCLIECYLSSSHFIFHEFSFPEQLSPLIDKLLIAQLEQFVPWPSSKSLFGRSKVRKNDNLASVAVAAAPRSQIESTIDALARILGHQRINIYASRPDPLDAPILINTGASTPEVRPGFCLDSRRLVTAFIATFAIHTLIWWQTASMDHEIRSVSAEVQSQSPLSQSSGSLVRSSHNVLIEQKRIGNSMTFMMDELARVLPDHTWVRSYQHSGRQIRIEGLAQDSASIISILENSGRFERVEFIGAIEKRREDGAEMFSIQATLKADQGNAQRSAKQ